MRFKRVQSSAGLATFLSLACRHLQHYRLRRIGSRFIFTKSPAPSCLAVTPATASLQTGATQQFSANVTGATNTNVTWSATGGAISSTGFYTAGNVAGNFSVTAVSASESTKTAQAAVTITSPPPGWVEGNRHTP